MSNSVHLLTAILVKFVASTNNQGHWHDDNFSLWVAANGILKITKRCRIFVTQYDY